MGAQPTAVAGRRWEQVASVGCVVLPLTSAALMYAAHRWAGWGGPFEHPRAMVCAAIGASAVALVLAVAIFVRGSRRWKPAMVASLSLLPQLVTFLVAAGLLLFPRQTFMFVAIHRGDEAAVRRALAWGVSPNAISHWGWNLENDGHTALSTAAEAGEVGVARLLLDRGANPNTPDGFGETPMQCAARSHSDAMIELLLARGARPPEPSRKIGKAPLAP